MRLMILLALLLVSGSLSAQTQGAIKRVCHVSRFELAVACIKKYEGLHGPKHHPYVGYGHKLLPGERFSPKMTKRQADALLRSDLRKLCAMFRGFGRDSLLLATLAYNVGCGKVMKSRMYANMLTECHGTAIDKRSLVLQGRSVHGTGCRTPCCRCASPCVCKKSKRPTTSYLSTCWVACRVTCWVACRVLVGARHKEK